MGFPASFRTIEIMQQVQHGFTAEYVQNLVTQWPVVKDYAYIIHDKEDKEPHIHLMLRFNNTVPTTAILAKLKGVCEVQHLQKMYKWNSAIAYLTHSNAPDKYRYDDSEVISNYEWQSDRDSAMTDKVQMQSILEAIAKDDCRGYNVQQFCTMEFYIKHKKQIETAFDYRRKQLEEERIDRIMNVLYMTGASGTGKTTYAKRFCRGKGWSFFVSSSSNDVLDGYEGQDCIILDDFRPSDWKIADLLKFLDNNTTSRAKSRYNNKSMVYCKCIIITSVLSVDELYTGLKEHDTEPIKQLKRRIMGVFSFTHEEITFIAYNPDTEDFDDRFATVSMNPFSTEFKRITMQKINDFIGGDFKPKPIGEDEEVPF